MFVWIEKTSDSSSIYSTPMRLHSLKTGCWPWKGANGSLRGRLFHHSETKCFPSHNTAIKFHQVSLHADSMSSCVHNKISFLQTQYNNRLITIHTGNIAGQRLSKELNSCEVQDMNVRGIHIWQEYICYNHTIQYLTIIITRKEVIKCELKMIRTVSYLSSDWCQTK